MKIPEVLFKFWLCEFHHKIWSCYKSGQTMTTNFEWITILIRFSVVADLSRAIKCILLLLLYQATYELSKFSTSKEFATLFSHSSEHWMWRVQRTNFFLCIGSRFSCITFTSRHWYCQREYLPLVDLFKR